MQFFPIQAENKQFQLIRLEHFDLRPLARTKKIDELEATNLNSLQFLINSHQIIHRGGNKMVTTFPSETSTTKIKRPDTNNNDATLKTFNQIKSSDLKVIHFLICCLSF